MKKSRFTIDLSDGFVLGIAVNTKEIQLGIIACIITIKFQKN